MLSVMDIFDTESCCQPEALHAEGRVVTLMDFGDEKPAVREAVFHRCVHCGRHWFRMLDDGKFYAAKGSI
jgi:hypothetical protein